MGTMIGSTGNNGLSFKLGSFTSGAGLAAGDYYLLSHSIVLWDYEGKIAGQICALKVTAVPGKVTGKNFQATSADPVFQHYSIGPATALGPDATGKRIAAVGQRSNLGKDSNFFIYLENLVNAGFPEDRFDNDVSVFDGTLVTIAQIPAPKRDNLPQSNVISSAGGQPQRENRTISVVSVVHRLPWEQGQTNLNAASHQPHAAAAAAGSASTPPTVAAPSIAASVAGGSPEGALLNALGTVLNGQQSMVRVNARVNLFKAMQGSPVEERNAALRIFNDDNALSAVLAGIGEGYYLEGTEIKRIG